MQGASAFGIHWPEADIEIAAATIELTARRKKRFIGCSGKLKQHAPPGY
jgi:hypothetical protein